MSLHSVVRVHRRRTQERGLKSSVVCVPLGFCYALHIHRTFSCVSSTQYTAEGHRRMSYVLCLYTLHRRGTQKGVPHTLCLCRAHCRGTQEGVLCPLSLHSIEQERMICTMSVQSIQKRDTGGCPMSRVPHLCPSLTAGCRLASQEADALLHHDESDQICNARYAKRHEGGGKGRIEMENTKRSFATRT